MPQYANAVALAGDPRSSNQAIQGVFAAGLSAAKGNVDGAAAAGLKYFATLKNRGNFVPVIGKAASIAQGATPIIIRWDYNALADRDTLNGNPKIQVIVPQTGVVAGVYVQAISAYAPHPNAAKLWMEYLYSDEGQLAVAQGLLPPDSLPEPGEHPTRCRPTCWPSSRPRLGYAKALFPTLAQQGQAAQVITKQWDTVVGANVK